MGNKSRMRKFKDVGKPWAQVRGASGFPPSRSPGWSGLVSRAVRFAVRAVDAGGDSRPVAHQPSRDRYLRALVGTKRIRAIGAMTRGLR